MEIQNLVPVLGKLVPAADAFPMIEDLQVEIAKSPYGNADNRQIERLDLSDMKENVDCHIPSCRHGGFNLGQTIRDMITRRKELLETQALCKGYRGSPKGKINYGLCRNFFVVRIRIRYKATNPR